MFRIADHLYLPQHDLRYLEFPGDDEKRLCTGYFSIRAPVFLGWPTTELIPFLDRAKAIATLELTWRRHGSPAGMAAFFANWFALTDLYYGRGDKALRWMNHTFDCMDSSGLCLSEVRADKPYFVSSYGNYILCLLAMTVQSYDDRILPFAAVPSTWKDFAFYNVPAESGIRVSGAMIDGKVRWIAYRHDENVLRVVEDSKPVRIRRTAQAVTVQPE